MGCRNVGRTLLCASALGLVAAAAPGAASAGINPSADCFGTASGAMPTKHEIGEPEADGSCTPRAGFTGDYTIVIDEPPTSGTAVVRGAGTQYPYVEYTASTLGSDGYTFHAQSSENGQISSSATVQTNNVAATNDPPQCLGQQSDDGPPTDLAIGEERFAGGCFDDEGESGPLTIQVVQNPSRGTLRVDNSDPARPLVYYRATCSGADDYSFTASDGVNTSAIFSGSVTNAAGTPCAGSPAPAPAKAVTPAPAATFSLKSVPSTVTVDRSGNASIPVSGTPGSKGSVSITASAPKSAKASAVARKKAKTLKLGSKGFTLPASGKTTVKVKVKGKGLKALKKAKKLSAKVTVKTDKVTVTKKLTLKAPKAKSKKKK